MAPATHTETIEEGPDVPAETTTKHPTRTTTSPTADKDPEIDVQEGVAQDITLTNNSKHTKNSLKASPKVI